MTRAEAIADGNVYYCLNCNTAYKELPRQLYEDGHGGRYKAFCRCGSDLFARLDNDESVED